MPEAREWFLQHVDELVKNQGLNCFRQDLMTSLEDDDPARKGITEMKHIAACTRCGIRCASVIPS